MTVKIANRFAAAALAAGMLVAAPALAQGAPGEATQAQPQAQAQQYGEGKIESFAAATSEINEIIQKWQPRLNEAASAEQAAELHQQAQQEMLTAVEGSGISVDEYNEIAMAAEEDPQLRQDILDRME